MRLRTLISPKHIHCPTPVNCNNKTAVGITNETVKEQRSRSMEMRFFGVTDQVKRGLFYVKWHTSQENLADYFMKHFIAKHHREVRPCYLHKRNSPGLLPQSAAPSTLQGCVGTLPNGYIKSSPLPRVNPKIRVTLGLRYLLIIYPTVSIQRT